jgi:hypothetical protein
MVTIRLAQSGAAVLESRLFARNEQARLDARGDELLEASNRRASRDAAETGHDLRRA